MNNGMQLPALDYNKKYEYTFAVVTRTNKTIYKLEENSPASNARILYLQIRRTTSNSRASGNSAIANADVFESAFLSLRKGQTRVIDRLPLALIEAATLQNAGFGYPIFLDNVDFNTSELEIANESAIVDGEVIELVVSFTKDNALR